MGDSIFRIAKVGEIIMIGGYMPALAIERGCGSLDRPRLIGMQQTPAGNQRVFMELIGNPERIEIPHGALVWEPTDEGLVDQYRESVSGLVIARHNVIPIGGRQ